MKWFILALAIDSYWWAKDTKEELEISRLKGRLYEEEFNMAYKMLTKEEQEVVRAQFDANEEFFVIARDKL